MGSTKRAIRRKQQSEATQQAVSRDDAPKKRVLRRSSSNGDAQQKALDKQAETTKRVNEAVKSTPLMTEIPGLPRSGGPWELKQGEGKIVVSEDARTELGGAQTVIIEIDAGAFRWLWEVAEANGLAQYRKYHEVGDLDTIAKAAQRAIAALRRAGHGNWPSHYKKSASKTKRVIKKKTTGTKKRVIRRKS